MSLEPLYKLDKAREQIWMIAASGNQIKTTFGFTLGKMQTTLRLVEPKNVGRANETSAPEQALKEARARWIKKQKEGYAPRGVDAKLQWAMLACDYNSRGHSIQFPCFVQPKLDGVRALFKDGVFYMRGGDPRFFGGVLERAVDDLGFPYPLDGELYSNLPFEELTGAILRAAQPGAFDTRIKLEFHIFDTTSGGPFEERISRLKILFSLARQALPARVFLVETVECKIAADVDDLLYNYIARGYEGIMLRNAYAPYRSGKRTSDLQKYKLFKDEEFEIVGYKRGNGRSENCVIWQCKTSKGHLFYAKPACTNDDSAFYLENAAKFMGRSLTVKFQEKTSKGIPRFPVAKCISS